ncbi:MAG: hypothetical protein R3F49_05145 [Planctomycetota bacterium]
MKLPSLSILACALATVAQAQVNQLVGPSLNVTTILDFDNPFVASGPISGTSSVFTSAGITSVTLVGTTTVSGDTMTTGSNVAGQGLVAQNGALAIAGPGEPLDNLAAGAGWDIQLANTATEFQVLFVDQVNMGYQIELFLGATSLGTGAFTYSGGFPNPPHYWTGTGAFDRVLITFPSGSGGVGIDEIAVDGGSPAIGTNYCTAVANSTGSAAVMSASGSASVAANNLVLEGAGLPTNAFGFFLTSLTQSNVPNPGGSAGTLCLGGSIGRYVGGGQIQNSGATGMISLAVDLGQHPSPSGFVQVNAGETWNFQAWYRDSVGGVATSNFTDGFEIVFVQ